MKSFCWISLLALFGTFNVSAVLDMDPYPYTLKENDVAGKKLVSFECHNNAGTKPSFNFTGSETYRDLFRQDRNSSWVTTILNRTMNIDGWAILNASNGCMKTIDLAEELHIDTICDQNVKGSLLRFETTDNYDPYFCYNSNCTIRTSFEVYLPEDTAINSMIYNFTICDNDTTVLQAPTGNRLNVDSQGIVEEKGGTLMYLKTKLDYESTREYKINIWPSTKNNHRGQNATFTIHVLDADDQGVAFTQNVYKCDIAENFIGSTMCIIATYDMDRGLNASIIYHIVSGSPSSEAFEINTTRNGTLTLGQIITNETLDRENVSSYTLYVMSYKKDRPVGSVNYTTIEITVTDVDDNPPILSPIPNEVKVLENSPHGIIVYQLSATDIDQGENAKFQYCLVDTTNVLHLFDVNNSTGVVTVHQDIDREGLTNDTINLKVCVAPHAQTCNVSKFCSNLMIQVIDENDNSPIFQNTSYTTEILKTSQVGAKVLAVTATDQDKGPNGQINYTLATTDSSFRIIEVEKSAVIILNKPLQEIFFERYNILVCAEDNAKYKRSTCVTVSIHVTDANIHPPKFDESVTKATLNVSENEDINTMLLELKASDKDPKDNLTFQLNTDKTLFKIYLNRYLVINGTLDREKEAQHNLSITVFDGQHNVSTNVQVNIQDVNDNNPIFVNSPYMFTIGEEQSFPNFACIHAADKDLAENAILSYSLDASSEIKDHFAIDSVTGCLSTVGVIDREKIQPPFTFYVFATDHGVPARTGKAVVTINVTDLNDNCPAFASKYVFLSVQESSNNSNFYTAQASDSDAGENSVIKYSLASGNQNMISINESTGVVALRPLTIFNCNNTTFNFEIMAANPTNCSGSHANESFSVRINIKDVNDHSPCWTWLNETMNYFDLHSLNKLLHWNGTPLAVDADCLDIYNTIFYWIESRDERITINSETGKISIYPPLNYLEPQCDRIIQFRIFASDISPNSLDQTHTILALIEINVTQAHRPLAPPRFDKDHYICVAAENTIGTFNCAVNLILCNDTHAEFRTNTSKFAVMPNGTLLVKESLDYEDIRERVLFVNVTGARAPNSEISSSTLVTVYLTNVDDASPRFANSSYLFGVLENGPNDGYLIGTLDISDVDSPFYVNTTCNEEYFELRNYGELWAKKSLDYDIPETNNKKFVCIAEARDSQQHAIANITISVIDANDNQPKFTNENYNKTINEIVPTGTSVIKLTATDGDYTEPNNQIAGYALVSGNDESYFQLNASSGEIRTNRSLTNAPPSFALLIKAMDNGHPQLAGYTLVKIRIYRRPQFLYTPYQAEVLENGIRVPILKMCTSGLDIASLTIKSDATHSFYISNNTLFSNNTDAESCLPNGTCTVSIEITDGTYKNDNKDVLNVTVRVIDVNEFAPYFSMNSYNVTINDTLAFDQHVTTIAARDKDINNSGFRYTLHHSFGDFKINSTTGAVTVANKFGQHGKIYNMRVEVLDSGERPKVNSTALIVCIQSTNKEIKLSIDHVINWQENNNSFSHEFKAKYTDDSYASNVKYEISGSTDDFSGTFMLNSSTGLLTLRPNSNLDYERTPIYRFQIIATDNGVFPYSATANVTISVQDVNETPNISVIPSTVYLQCNSSAGTFVAYAQVTDVDKDKLCQNCTYTLSNKRFFNITSKGNIVLTSALCSNTSLTIAIKDGNLSNHANVLIIFPLIMKSNLRFEIYENYIGNITNLTGNMFEIVPSTFSGKFRILENGTLLVIDPFDREATDSVVISVRMYKNYNGSSILSEEFTISVNIKDVNDCVPEFPSNYSIMVDDDSKLGFQIATMAAVDRDADSINRNISYQINGNFRDAFDININGELRVRNLSRYNETMYTIQIIAKDGIHSGSAHVAITVVDTNNHSPKFDVDIYNFNVTEGKSYEHIGDVKASDLDNNSYGNISYRIESIYQELFSISENGRIVTKQPLDREMVSAYTLIVIAQDGDLTNQRQGICTVNIHIEDINDNPPTFKDNVYEGFVAENETQNSAVKMLPAINATDPDLGTNGTEGIEYYLEGGQVPFCIDNATATLSLCSGGLDREKKQSYQFKVVAYDSKRGQRCQNASVNVTVQVTDVNDETPWFRNKNYTFSVMENASLSTLVGNVNAMDNDSASSQTIRYTIPAGQQSKFYIDSGSGDIYVGGDLDREKNDTYHLTLKVSDGLHDNSTQVIIHILDVNDNAPQFQSVKDIYIYEDASPNQQCIYQISATDLDETNTNNSHIEFSTKNAHRAPFAINLKGCVTINSTLDRERNDTYTIDITAADLGTPQRSSTETFWIHVLDVNDNSPIFCNDKVKETCVKITTPVTVVMVEKLPVKSIMALIQTYDPDDGPNGTVKYEMQTSKVSNYFMIENHVGNIGILRIKEMVAINSLVGENVIATNDTKHVQLSFIITAKDGGPHGGLNSTIECVVNVEPINDNAPVFDKNVYTFTIEEGQPHDTFVGDCLATIPNGTYFHISYSIIPNMEEFKIDKSTGRVFCTKTLDREKQSNYRFIIKVTDGRTPERTAFAAVDVIVNDTNDNGPIFHQQDIVIKVPENEIYKNGTDVSASDRDIGVNAALRYKIRNDYGHRFYLDPNGTVFLNGTLDYEERHFYSLEIVATDGGNKSSTLHVLVQVLDKNDNDPKFYLQKTSFDVRENHLSELNVRVFANDSDASCNGTVVYKLVSADGGPFSIDPFDGIVSLLEPLDYEQRQSYDLEIQAWDDGCPPNKAEQHITIHVINEDDDIPNFGHSVYTSFISKSHVLHEPFLKLDTNVKDVNFTLDKGGDAEYFKIDVSGNLYLERMPEGKTVFIFNVTATTQQNASATCTAIIHVTGVEVLAEEHSFMGHIEEGDTGVVFDLSKLRFADIFGEPIVYNITDVEPNDNRSFYIEEDGKVICRKALDREKHETYQVYISAIGSTRMKRDALPEKSPHSIKLTVTIDDVNDNIPSFNHSQKRVFGVPRLTRAGKSVAKLTAYDPDLVGQVFYTMDATALPFAVDIETGDISALSDLLNLEHYELACFAYNNRSNLSDRLIIKIYVFPTEYQLKFVVNISVSAFEKQRNFIIRNMSTILGVDLRLGTWQSLRIPTESLNIYNVNPNSTEFYVHGCSTNDDMECSEIIARQQMLRSIEANATKLAVLGVRFDPSAKEEHENPSAFSLSSIALISMATLIFVGSFVALVVLQVSWHSYEEDVKSHENDNDEYYQLELSPVRSRQSSKLSFSNTPATARNPAYKETEFNTRVNGTLTKKVQEYKTQELRIRVGSEPIGSNLPEAHIPVAMEIAKRVADSGVGKSSMEKSESSKCSIESFRIRNDDEGITRNNVQRNDGKAPMMTSSPRINFHNVYVENNQESASLDNEDSVILLDATGEAETEDGITYQLEPTENSEAVNDVKFQEAKDNNVKCDESIVKLSVVMPEQSLVQVVSQHDAVEEHAHTAVQLNEDMHTDEDSIEDTAF